MPSVQGQEEGSPNLEVGCIVCITLSCSEREGKLTRFDEEHGKWHVMGGDGKVRETKCDPVSL